MFGDDILVRTLLLPPRLPRRWLARDRLDSLLSGIVEYPLTVVSASAGYGKSTALAAFAAQDRFSVAWYTLGEGCDDPLVFLVHLIHAYRTLAPGAGEGALAILQHGGSGAQVWNQALDSLLNNLVPTLSRETVLILDDYHTVDDHPDIRALIERLIARMPPLLHVVLATRRRPQLESMPALRVRGELLDIGERDLAFTVDEIRQLFNSAYGYGLGAGEAPEVGAQTGGWAIALQLVWQSRQANVNAQSGVQGAESPVAGTPHLALDVQGREALFAYLAREVLARQPEDTRSFLLRSSVLSELEPAACDRVLAVADSAARLEEIYRQGLFLTQLGGGVYRYHPLFQSFLQERAGAALPEWNELHARAADYYRETGGGEQVLYHLLAMGDASGATRELERLAHGWLENGRMVTLLAWIDQVSAEMLAAHPQLLIARGDANRLLARFDATRQAYEQAAQIFEANRDAAGQARALRGQAMVYVDTVQPLSAEPLLRQAFRLLPPTEQSARAELLGLIAENRLNMGRADQALRILDFGFSILEEGGTSKRGAESPERILGNLKSRIQNRALVRLGRLREARANLEADVARDRESVARGRPSEAHREVTLLLSLVSAMEGSPEGALGYAREGLEAARRLGSILFEAGACICMGHALQLAGSQDYREANEYYLQAMALADNFHVERTKAEAYMGLALLHGFRGDLAAAQAAAQEGLSIVERSGDEWTSAQLWTALGAVGTACGSAEAREHLDRAMELYRTSKDAYGQAVVCLWLSVSHYRSGERDEATHYALRAFELAQRHGYDGLLTSPTLFGPRDPMMLVPVLLAARDNPSYSSAAQSLLNRGFPAIAADATTRSYHPGVTLRIHTLGPLRVWRGSEEIGSHEWQRKKAPEMLALLLTNRDRWLLREQICDRLWPEEEQEEAEAQFKVTLNGLNTALEPLRPPRTPPFYIRRQGGAYRFAPPGGVWLDVEEFESRLAAARALRIRNSEFGVGNEEQQAGIQQSEDLVAAVELYQGEYLSDWLYEDWTRDTRERLEGRYMEAATLLADSLVAQNELTEAIRLCEAVLSRDPAWEDAYGVLMRAYARQGQRRLALATYERCVRNLREYLDIEPRSETVRIYEEVKIGNPGAAGPTEGPLRPSLRAPLPGQGEGSREL